MPLRTAELDRRRLALP